MSAIIDFHIKWNVLAFGSLETSHKHKFSHAKLSKRAKKKELAKEKLTFYHAISFSIYLSEVKQVPFLGNFVWLSCIIVSFVEELSQRQCLRKHPESETFTTCFALHAPCKHSLQTI
jgi:hypothetical protein